MYHNSAKTLYDLHWVSSIKLAVGFISNPISFASHHNLNWSVRSSFLWEQDRKVNDTWSFILSDTRLGTEPEFWQLISICLNSPLCRTLSKCFKSFSDWGCFHISVPRPFIVQGRVLYTREKILDMSYWLKNMVCLERSFPMLCNKQPKDEELKSKESQIRCFLLFLSESSYATKLFIWVCING